MQNKVALATPLLPQEVQLQGVRVTKSVNNFLLVVGFVSEDGSMSNADLADFNVSTIQDPISRLPGVGDIQTFGTQYAMRIWLDPDKLTKYQLATTDVTTAVVAQNAQVSAGALGDLPAMPGQLLNATIMAQSRLKTPEQFGAILLRVQTDGSRVYLRDVARLELGSESYTTLARYSGKPAAGMAIKPAAGANALDTVTAVKKKVEELTPFFPPGVKAIYPFDTTPFVRISIKEVVKTLVEAIGLLVDDAIVVVENVERVMQEEGLSPRDATRKSMDQISGALIGIGLVLCAAFVPMAFFSGSTGVIYRQFSITIASAVALSVLVALVLTPALCATMLKPIPKGHHEQAWLLRLV